MIVRGNLEMRHLAHLQSLDNPVMVEVYQQTFTKDDIGLFGVVARHAKDCRFVVICPPEVEPTLKNMGNVFVSTMEEDRDRLVSAARAEVENNGSSVSGP